MKRKLFLATSISAALSACSPIGTKLNESSGFHKVLESAESVNQTLIGTRGRVREYSRADISADFPLNSFDTPSDSVYTHLIAAHFRPYVLPVDGAVENPLKLSLAQLEHMMNVSQITRHDCVEG
jgi:DMSO/TMAO reductase YedYZ molybdopterin-dependent catalytic subunit